MHGCRKLYRWLSPWALVPRNEPDKHPAEDGEPGRPPRLESSGGEEEHKGTARLAREPRCRKCGPRLGGHVSLFQIRLHSPWLHDACDVPVTWLWPFVYVCPPACHNWAVGARAPVLLPGPCSVRNSFAMHPCSPRLRAGCVSPASFRPMLFLRRLHTGIPARPACASRMPSV